MMMNTNLQQTPYLKPLDSPGDLPATRLRKAVPKDRHEALTQQAQKWVAQTFFGTLLKQMHESPFKSHLLDGGRGGEAFQPLMDQQLIERMSHATGRKLVRGIVRQIEGREAYRKHSPSPTGTPGGEGRGEGGGDRLNGARLQNDSSPPHPNPLPRSTGGEGTGENLYRDIKIHVAPGLRA